MFGRFHASPKITSHIVAKFHEEPPEAKGNLLLNQLTHSFGFLFADFDLLVLSRLLK